MKTTRNCLCALTQFTTQAIQTTIKTAIVCLAVFLNLNSGFGQSCSPKSNPLQASKRCAVKNGNDLDSTWNAAIEQYNLDYNGTIGDKKKFRSMFLSQRLNGRGGFIQVDSTNSNVFYFNPNAVGSTLGVDEDGDCVYEREDDLLDELERLEYDEIIIVGVSGLLKEGSKTASSIDVANDNFNPYDNIMHEQERMDYHLARFIYKAKTEYSLDVLANLSYNIDPNDFYDYLSTFHDSAVSRNGSYDFVREHFENYMLEFLDNHIQTWQNDPTQMDYIGYNELPPVLPLDAEGRISNVDKYIIDLYNLHLFEFRVKHDLIAASATSGCSPIGSGVNSCDNAFDGHMYEWEWWNNADANGNPIPKAIFKPDVKLDGLLALITMSDTLSLYSQRCYDNDYVVQDDFFDTAWASINLHYTIQERANLVDSIADRVYLYAYHNNPCDCYWGSQSSTYNKYKNQIALLANNGFGANMNTSPTNIITVFNGKYHDAQKKAMPRPEFYGDSNVGCANSSDDCDYCPDLSGNALKALENDTNYYPTLGYIENTFQQQYDYDTANTGSGNSDNVIFGYCWFKSRMILDPTLKVQTSVEDLTIENGAESSVNIYPNPSAGVINYTSKEEIRQLFIYSSAGNLLQEQSPSSTQGTIDLRDKGVFFIQMVLESGKTEVKRAIVW